MEAGVYEHYKGGFYQCLGVAEHSETHEALVIYVSLTGADLPGPRLRARPLADWNDIVDWPDRKHKPRYLYRGLTIPTRGDDEKGGVDQ